MNNSHNSRTALVLGGGGSTGNAWLIGLVAGLFEAGLDVTCADVIIGTSAGATAAAQLTGATPPELLAGILTAESQPQTGSAGPGRGAGPRSTANHLEVTAAIIAASADVVDMRRRMGAWGRERAATSLSSDQWRAIVASRLPRAEWPQQRLQLTAVDANSGKPVAFDSDSGVDLADAVAASTAGGFAYAIGEGRYIDGGYRTNADNADLAAGYKKVLVLSPFSGRTRLPLSWGLDLATQVAELRSNGSAVETIFPTDDSGHLFGVNGMDLSLRSAAARAGCDQAMALAAKLTEFWR